MDKNLFGSRIVLTAASDEKVEKGGKDRSSKAKEADLIQIFLATIPSLRDATSDLSEARDQLSDEGLKVKTDGWLEAIRNIQVEILETTIEAVRGSGIPVDEEAAAPVETDAILGTKPKADKNAPITPEGLAKILGE